MGFGLYWYSGCVLHCWIIVPLGRNPCVFCHLSHSYALHLVVGRRVEQKSCIEGGNYPSKHHEFL